jgi:hypothetical protein
MINKMQLFSIKILNFKYKFIFNLLLFILIYTLLLKTNSQINFIQNLPNEETANANIDWKATALQYEELLEKKQNTINHLRNFKAELNRQNVLLIAQNASLGEQNMQLNALLEEQNLELKKFLIGSKIEVPYSLEIELGIQKEIEKYENKLFLLQGSPVLFENTTEIAFLKAKLEDLKALQEYGNNNNFIYVLKDPTSIPSDSLYGLLLSLHHKIDNLKKN